MTTREQTIQALRAAIKSITGWPDARVVVVDAGQMRGALSYVAVQLVADVPVDLPDPIEAAGTGGSWTVAASELRRVAFLVSGYGAGTDEVLRAVGARLTMPGPIARAASAAGLEVVRASDVVDVSELVSSAREPRYRLTLDGYVRATYAALTVDTVAQAVVEIDLTDAEGDVVASVDLTIPEP